MEELLFSDNFDGISILYLKNPDLDASLKGVLCLDNISACKALEENPFAVLSRCESKNYVHEVSRAKRRQQFMENVMKRNMNTEKLTQTIADKARGPLELLSRNMNLLVEVRCKGDFRTIREYHGILVAFDKHFNLVLKNCKEYFWVKDSMTICKRYDKRSRLITKSVNSKVARFHQMIFIRGEFLIIVISKAIKS